MNTGWSYVNGGSVKGEVEMYERGRCVNRKMALCYEQGGSDV